MNHPAVPAAPLRALRYVAVCAGLYAAGIAWPASARAADLAAVNSAARSASGAAVTGSAVPALGFGALMQTVFGLALVIGLVFGCAWLARRLGLQGPTRSALVKTVGSASLGGKERVAVVEIGDTWLVLGTAPGNVRLLHTLPAGEVPGAAPPPGNTALPATFAQRFRDALKAEAGKRFKRHDGGAQ